MSPRTVLRALGAFAMAMLLAWASRAPMRVRDAEDGAVRLALSARPERVEHCVARSDEELAQLPEHMRQRVECEGRSARYHLVLRRDGAVLADEIVAGAGARHDRPIYLLREFAVPPGPSYVEVTFERLDSVAAGPSEAGRDRERREAIPPRLEYAGRHEIGVRSVLLVTYDAERRALVARGPAGQQ